MFYSLWCETRDWVHKVIKVVFTDMKARESWGHALRWPLARGQFVLRWPLRSACTSFFAVALRVLDTPAPCHFKTCIFWLHILYKSLCCIISIYARKCVSKSSPNWDTHMRSSSSSRLVFIGQAKVQSNFDHASLSTPRWHCAARNHYCAAQAIEMNGFQGAALHVPRHMWRNTQA